MVKLLKNKKVEKKIEKKVEDKVEKKIEKVEEKKLSGSAELAAKINSIIRGK